jgi:hypothetical protein
MEYGTLAAEFTPIAFKLSTQAEIDFLYTLLANASDTLVGDFGLAEEVDNLTSFLEEYASVDCFDTEWAVEDFYAPLDEPVDVGPAGKNTSMYEHKPKNLGELLQCESTYSQEYGEGTEHPCKGGCEACAGCTASDNNYDVDETNRIKQAIEKFFAEQDKQQGNK